MKMIIVDCIFMDKKISVMVYASRRISALYTPPPPENGVLFQGGHEAVVSGG